MQVLSLGLQQSNDQELPLHDRRIYYCLKHSPARFKHTHNRIEKKLLTPTREN